MTRKRGRPTLAVGHKKYHRFPMTTDDIWEYVLELGREGGNRPNASRGIEILVEFHKANSVTVSEQETRTQTGE